MAVNTNGVCSTCGGKLRNAQGRRLTVEQLVERHNTTCPGLLRVNSTRKATSS